MRIIIRPFEYKGDAGLIFDSFPKQARFGALDHLPKETYREWHQELHAAIQAMTLLSEIRIACFQEAPDSIAGLFYS